MTKTKLFWDREKDRLSIIKSYSDEFKSMDYCDIAKSITVHGLGETFSKYIPWLIDRIEKLENQPRCPNHKYFLRQLALCPFCGNYDNCYLSDKPNINPNECKKIHDQD
ncbi:MAG: hypothetical protein WC495_05610 [Patescibacteria group bacterium]